MDPRLIPILLVDGRLQNLLLQSQTFDSASWTKTNGSVSADAAAAPNGTTTADKFVPSAGFGYHFLLQTPATIAGAIYTFSIHAQAAGYGYVLLFSFTSGVGAKFSLADGAFASGTDYTTASSYHSTNLGNGIWRLDFQFVATGATNELRVYVTDDAVGDQQFTGDGTSGANLWGAQLNTGPRALRYTPTTTTVVS